LRWVDEWNGISARISGLARAVELFVATLSVQHSDSYGIARTVISEDIKSIYGNLRTFYDAYSQILPKMASTALKAFLESTNVDSDLNSEIPRAQRIISFEAFRVRFEYLIRDFEGEARARIELAFEHLRRSIVVDEDIRNKWLAAFSSHETRCEKLGAVHLLSHGIFAFKVAAGGAATDLVFGDPVDDREDMLRRSARALVLTEWKRVTDVGKALLQATEARTQAAMYGAGVLADIEIKSMRYIVLVAKEDAPPPPDVIVGNMTYRHIWIAVSPSVPSKIAKKSKAGI
jgi:hypothetical protein